MSLVQYILIAFAVVVMVLGLYMVWRGMHNRAQNNELEYTQYDKNGIPIIPRHQRNVVDPKDLDESFAGETVIVPDRGHLQPVIKESRSSHSIDIPPSERQQYRATDYEDEAYEQRAPVVNLEDHDPTIYGFDYEGGNAKQQLTDNYDEPEHGHSAYADSTDEEKEEDLFSSLASATENLLPAVETVEMPDFNDNSPMLDEHLLSLAEQDDQHGPLNNAQENLNITLVPNNGARIAGTTVFEVIQQYGLKFGPMNMFHRYENKDGSGILWFSMMGMVNGDVQPFNIQSLPKSRFDGLILFLSLPHPKALQGFDSMMSTMSLIANQLDMSVYDESGEVLTRERRQQLREKVRDYQHTLHTS